MVRLIMGANGAGKTKQLIDLIHSAVESENGSVVCIEPGADMTFDIKSSVRLVNGGLYAGNYDISHVFVDNLSKVVGSNSLPDVENFLHWLDRFSEANSVKFTVTLSMDEGTATEGMRNYL